MSFLVVFTSYMIRHIFTFFCFLLIHALCLLGICSLCSLYVQACAARSDFFPFFIPPLLLNLQFVAPDTLLSDSLCCGLQILPDISSPEVARDCIGSGCFRHCFLFLQTVARGCLHAQMLGFHRNQINCNCACTAVRERHLLRLTSLLPGDIKLRHKLRET